MKHWCSGQIGAGREIQETKLNFLPKWECKYSGRGLFKLSPWGNSCYHFWVHCPVVGGELLLFVRTSRWQERQDTEWRWGRTEDLPGISASPVTQSYSNDLLSKMASISSTFQISCIFFCPILTRNHMEKRVLGNVVPSLSQEMG